MPDFLLFLATSLAITMAPGPDNLQVLARGISQGRAAGFVAALGFAAGITFHTTLAALGVAALLRSSQVVFAAFGVCAGMIGNWLKRRPRVGVWLDRLAGATFIAIGIRVALRD